MKAISALLAEAKRPVFVWGGGVGMAGVRTELADWLTGSGMPFARRSARMRISGSPGSRISPPGFTGRELRTLIPLEKDSSYFVSGGSVVFSPDSQRLAACAFALPGGNVVKVWEVPGGKELLTLKPNFGTAGRQELEKWFEPGLAEHFMDGLRKTGLEISEVQKEDGSKRRSNNMIPR